MGKESNFSNFIQDLGNNIKSNFNIGTSLPVQDFSNKLGSYYSNIIVSLTSSTHSFQGSYYKCVTIPSSYGSVTADKIISGYSVLGVQGTATPAMFNVASYMTHTVTTVNLSGISTIGVGAFNSQSMLTNVYNCQSVTSIGSNAFAFCSQLQSLDLPVCSKMGDYVFYSCASLSKLTIGTELSTVCSISNTTLFLAGLTSIYVPTSMLNSYKTATNWSAYSSIIYGV